MSESGFTGWEDFQDGLVGEWVVVVRMGIGGMGGCEDFEEGLVVVGGDWGKGILDSSLRSE